MRITLVKKVLADGSPCKKCAEVLSKMEAADQLRFIDAIVIADEADKSSPGMILAAQHKVNRAPFFIVERDGQQAEIYTVYFKLVKDVLEGLDLDSV
ncbi:MAG: hypothetical protein AAFZ92_00845 [Pseudomonadota bacterium]